MICSFVHFSFGANSWSSHAIWLAPFNICTTLILINAILKKNLTERVEKSKCDVEDISLCMNEVNENSDNKLW